MFPLTQLSLSGTAHWQSRDVEGPTTADVDVRTSILLIQLFASSKKLPETAAFVYHHRIFSLLKTVDFMLQMRLNHNFRAAARNSGTLHENRLDCMSARVTEQRKSSNTGVTEDGTRSPLPEYDLKVVKGIQNSAERRGISPSTRF
jgi:hypothetical protein